MGRKLAATVGGIQKIAKNIFITGTDLLHHKVKKAFITQKGVHCLAFSSGKAWKKYSCIQGETNAEYREVSASGEWSIGDTFTSTYYRLSYYTTYRFDTQSGYIGDGGGEATTAAELPSEGYMVEDTVVWRMLSCTPINDETSAIAEVSWECVGLCEGSEGESYYDKGSTLYGTIDAEEGTLPEDGILIEGSATGEYCVLLVDGEYYYYEAYATVTPTPVTSNFALADGSILITSDRKIFEAQ